MFDESMMAARFLAGLPQFLRHPPSSLSAARAELEQSLQRRASVFLELIRRGIFEHASSPYRPLLQHAGIAYQDVADLVGAHGVDGALERLYDAGVRVTLDEFKGRRPIERGGLSISTNGSVFDNPLMTRHFETRSSGSRGPGGRFIVDLGLLAHEGHYDEIFVDMFGLDRRPGALWHPGPPGSAGLKWALRFARAGRSFDRWFSQTPVSFGHDARRAALLRAITFISRRSGRPIPMPEHVNLQDAVVIARWLADRTAEGSPAWLSTTASAAVRVCTASREHGLDISGTLFRASGEPLSPAKSELIAQTDCLARCHYAMAEIGRLGMACGHPEAIDSVHVMMDKIAILQREVSVGGGSATVPGLVLTSLLWSVPKIMLNVEIGDYAVMGRPHCGCIWEQMGYTQQLHTIRSYEKLTSGGMHFIGADLIKVVEEVLPATFGGAPTDYQFVEEEQDGLSVVSLVISPRVGARDDASVARAVLDALAARGVANKMMAGVWRDGQTLRVVRREPYSTVTGKIHTLHVRQPVKAKR